MMLPLPNMRKLLDSRAQGRCLRSHAYTCAHVSMCHYSSWRYNLHRLRLAQGLTLAGVQDHDVHARLSQHPHALLILWPRPYRCPHQQAPLQQARCDVSFMCVPQQHQSHVDMCFAVLSFLAMYMLLSSCPSLLANMSSNAAHGWDCTKHLAVKTGRRCAGQLCMAVGLPHLRSLHAPHVLSLLLRRHVVVHEPDAAELRHCIAAVCSGVMVPVRVS